jgi:hypothetical protein
MNDGELITALRGQRNTIPMTTPVEQIINRGHAIRARRRIPGLAGALAVVAGAALLVTVLLPSSHQPSAQLAAWTVSKQGDGNISVTIRQLLDPAGLQTKLRADGVLASVTFVDNQNPSCRPYPASQTLWNSVFLPPPAGARYIVIVIRPSALPSGVGVQIGSGASSSPQQQGGVERPTLVYASRQCTGS